MVSRFMSWMRGDDLNDRLDRLNGPIGMNVRQAAGDQIVRWNKGKPAYTDKNVRSFDREAYRKASLIFACVRYMSKSAGSVPLKVYQTLPNGQEDEAAEHPLRQLLKQPNPAMGESRFISFVTMVASIAGYCVVEKERDGYGNVVNLWPLRPDWLRPIPRSAGETDWQYTVPGYAEPFIIEDRDAIAISYADTMTGDPLGIGPVEVIFREAGISTALTDFISRFIENDAMPQYMLIPDMEGKLAAQWHKPETVDAFYEQFRQRYMGRGRERDIVVSPAIKGVERLTMNMNELAYRDLRDVSDLSITTAFGIPPILLGTSSGLAHATYANYQEARRSYWEDELVSWLTRFDDAFTRQLMTEFWPSEGYDLRFDLSDVPAMKEDEHQLHERARNDFSASLVSRHTAQRMAGIEPHGPDDFLVPFSAVTVPNSGGERSAVTATVERMDERAAIGAGMDAIIERDGRRYVNRDAQTPEQRAAADTIAQKNKAQIVRLAEQVEPVLTRFFHEQAGRIVEIAMRDRERTWETRAIENIDWDDEDERLVEALRQWWGTVSEVAFDDVSSLAGVTVDWSLSNPHLADLFDILGYRVRDINETTRQAIETIVRESLVDGTTIPDLADSLRDVVEETYRGRAESIARTESQFAYNTSSQRAYQASGVVRMVQMHDGVECESGPGSDGLTCPQRNQMIVRVEDMNRHINAEHPRGTLAFSPLVDPLGDEA